MYLIKEKCVIHFKLSVDFIGCDYSKEMTMQPMILWLSGEIKYAHLTNNAKWNSFFKCEKKGYATTWDAYFFLQMTMQPFLYEILITNQLSKPSASTMQMQKCMNMPKIKYFCILEVNEI